MPVTDRPKLLPPAVEDRASKAVAPMGAAMAERSPRSSRSGSSPVSLSVLEGVPPAN